jgi:hypothetical protein
MAIWFPSFEINSVSGSMQPYYQLYTITDPSAGEGGLWDLPDVNSGGISNGWSIWINDSGGYISINEGGLTIQDPNGALINGLTEVKLGHSNGWWRFTYMFGEWLMEKIDYRDEILLTEANPPGALSGIQISDKHFDFDGVQTTSYRLKALTELPGGSNNYVVYLGTITNSGSGRVIPHQTTGIVNANVSSLGDISSSFANNASVQRDSTGDIDAGRLFIIQLDETSSGIFDVYMIATASFDFTCNISVDFEFLVVFGDEIRFQNT